MISEPLELLFAIGSARILFLPIFCNIMDLKGINAVVRP